VRRLGIDLGTVRTGLAAAEAELRVATPLRTITHTNLSEVVTAVAETMQSERFDEAILGLPLELDGREGEAARRVRRFAELLAKRTHKPVRLWDERLSTAAADRSLREQNVRGGAKRRIVDQIAATLLLQSYLDALPDREA
jgi:putative Holliday junction resolvase